MAGCCGKKKKQQEKYNVFHDPVTRKTFGMQVKKLNNLSKAESPMVQAEEILHEVFFLFDF